MINFRSYSYQTLDDVKKIVNSLKDDPDKTKVIREFAYVIRK